MNSIIILLSIILIYILYCVKSPRAVEFFRAVCPTTIRKNCNKVLIAGALNDINERLFKLRKVIVADTTHIEYNKMYDWYTNKTSLNNVVLNKVNLKNTQGLIKQANRDYIKMKNQLNKPPGSTNTANRTISKPSKLVNNLVQETIRNSVKNKQYIELLDEWADIKKDAIIKSTKKYKSKLNKILRMRINKTNISRHRRKLKISATNKPNTAMELNKITRMSDTEIEGDIKLQLSRPILNEAKAAAKLIATTMKKTVPQLKREIILMKRLKMRKINNKYGPV